MTNPVQGVGYRSLGVSAPLFIRDIGAAAQREIEIDRIKVYLKKLAAEAGDKSSKNDYNIDAAIAAAVVEKLPKGAKFSLDCKTTYSDGDHITGDDPAIVDLNKWAEELYKNGYEIRIEPVDKGIAGKRFVEAEVIKKIK